jgi:hypothetical protein
MRHSLRSARTPSQFPFTLHQNLNAYALGAAAAGVALLAVAPPADAEIVFTPVNGSIASGSKYALDLNHDGVIDFTLENDLHLSTTPFGDDLNIVPAVKGNAVWQGAHERYGQLTAAALAAGVPVDSGKPFIFQEVNMAYASLVAGTPQYVSGGPWKNVTNRFLGLRFLIDGEVHYGWARLTVLTDSHRETVEATITGYAYETVANQPILTGQISGTANDASITLPTETLRPALPLALLALGSPGLPAPISRVAPRGDQLNQ